MLRIIRNICPHGLYRYMKQKRDSISEAKMDLVGEPLIFNESGKRLRVFYLQDTASKYSYSFTAGRQSETVFWDRDNYRLPIHFYTHFELFNTRKTAAKKFGLILEPEEMVPDLYQKLYENPNVVMEFDAIFTHSSKFLEKYKNAVLYLGQGAWFGTQIGGGTLDPFAYTKKTKNVSMVSSDKAILPSHRYRIELAKHLASGATVDTFGSFDGGVSVKICETLEAYRFSVILENEISPYYFTEKLLNCFAAMTIPIYAGATNISQFFDPSGIITLDKSMSFKAIDSLVASCNRELYIKKLSAVKTNYEKALGLLCLDDHIYKSNLERFNK